MENKIKESFNFLKIDYACRFAVEGKVDKKVDEALRVVTEGLDKAEKNDLILDIVKRFIKSDQQDIFDWCEEYDEVNNTNITKLINEWLKGE